MGGWNIFYALINFAILAAGLFLFGKKIVLKMYREHRDSIKTGLESSARAAEKAAELRQLAQEESFDEMPETGNDHGDSSGDAAKEQAERDAFERLMREENSEYAERVQAEIHKRLGDVLGRELADRTAALFAEDEKLGTELIGRFLGWLEENLDVEAALHTARTQDDVLNVAVSTARGGMEAYTRQAVELIEKKLPDVEKNIRVIVKPRIIDGMRVIIGDVLYDGSLKRQLDKAAALVSDAVSRNEPLDEIHRVIMDFSGEMETVQVGHVISVSDGICRATGLSGVMESELLYLGGGLDGIVMDLEDDNVGLALLGNSDDVREGDEIRRSGKMVSIPVGAGIIGRVVNALGKPQDAGGAVFADEYRCVEAPAAGIVDRKPVKVPMQTGIKAIDALVPIGRGQRELIIGDRQTGKSTIALDTIINQKGKDVVCIYVAIGQKESTVAGFVNKLKAAGAMEYTVVVCANASEPAPMLYLAPYAGTAIGEYFMYRGRDVLIVYDDLSKHAVAYRELSLLLHRPSGREAYPGDVFYLHSRLLERAACLSDENGGGSMTALPIIETQAGDISAYIPTNVISITDGQIYLETELFNSGVRPAVNMGLSVSRVGGSAQLGAMKQVAGRMRLDLAQYRELAAFTEFSSELDKATMFTLRRGERAAEILRQPCHEPMDVCDQVVSVFAVNEGFADKVELADMSRFEKELLSHVRQELPQLSHEILSGQKLSKESLDRLREVIGAFADDWK